MSNKPRVQPYNSVATIAFNVEHSSRGGASPVELINALMTRVINIIESQEVDAACGDIDDTQDNWNLGKDFTENQLFGANLVDFIEAEIGRR